eukprot:TRINITY_DN15387_c1_g1_i6.p2 TRINITY_DN15387_c1_g1~~TRINITY_DN15387_c1_g1_i6.p2  ORF type:complete len:153 (-),score=1.55 TRINITY_DN15387_c1_g1_i6:261-719(-)
MILFFKNIPSLKSKYFQVKLVLHKAIDYPNFQEKVGFKLTQEQGIRVQQTFDSVQVMQKIFLKINQINCTQPQVNIHYGRFQICKFIRFTYNLQYLFDTTRKFKNLEKWQKNLSNYTIFLTKLPNNPQASQNSSGQPSSNLSKHELYEKAGN